MSVRVVAPCRLHFGLFHVPVDGLTHDRDGRPVRKFGGLGLMIDNPRVTVTSAGSGDVVSGSLAKRAAEFIGRIESARCSPVELEDGSIGEFTYYHWPGAWTANGPPEHVGLGVGTALGLAVTGVFHDHAWVNSSPDNEVYWHDYARTVGRGRRSGIGITGFMRGGFVLDFGKADTDEPLRTTVRFDFPTHWRVVLVRPPTPPEWFGDRERTAFARGRVAEVALNLTDRLIELAHNTVVSAVRAADFDTFAQSIFEFNRLAGEPFHDDQGGPYAGAEVACVIDELMEMGAVGVGQSSWGPTVFAMCHDADEAERLATKARARFSSATEVTVTAANNTGARIETL